MRNKRFWYLFTALLIYVVIISFPTYLLTTDIVIKYSVEVGLRSAYLIFIIIFSIFTKIAKTYNGKTRFSNLFLLLPLFFVAFFYLFYWGVVARSPSLPNPLENVFNPNGDNTIEILEFSAIVLMVVEEELLFRFILQRNLLTGHKIARIAITSAIYMVCHFFFMLYHSSGIINPIELLELIFIYGIGIILGFLYEYTNNIGVPIAFSLIFTICKRLINEVNFASASWKFYLTLSLFAVYAAGYLLIFYFLMLKKENR